MSKRKSAVGLTGRSAHIVTAALFALLLAGCGGTEQAADSAAEDQPTTSVSAELLDAQASAPGTGGDEGDVEAIDVSALGFDAGAAEAPVKVVEFSDFGCPHCRQFHMETYPTLHDAYVETGKVQWKYIPILLGIFGPNAEAAALAAECAGAQERFASVRDRIFEAQDEWRGSDNVESPLRRYVEDEGLDMAEWDACMGERRPAGRLIAGTELANQAGVRGTPTFYLSGLGVIPGAVPADVFSEVLDSALVALDRAGATDPGD